MRLSNLVHEGFTLRVPCSRTWHLAICHSTARQRNHVYVGMGSKSSSLLHRCSDNAARCLAVSAASNAQPDSPLHAPEDLQSYPFYSQYPLDRKAEWRRDAKQIAKLLAHPRVHLLPVHNGKVLVHALQQPQVTSVASNAAGAHASAPSVVQAPAQVATATSAIGMRVQESSATLAPYFICPEDQPLTAAALSIALEISNPATPATAATATTTTDTTTTSDSSSSSSSSSTSKPAAQVFLGLDTSGIPYFAVEVRSAAHAGALVEAAQQELAMQQQQAERDQRTAGLEAGMSGAELVRVSTNLQWQAARSAAPEMRPEEAALVATACGLIGWHDTALFHGTTGAPTQQAPGGYGRRCTAGGGSLYPRIDPAVIMLVTSSCDQYALLGRKAEWPKDRYSTLAGFLDLGEPLEAAVVREVQEEAGITTSPSSVCYVASQPWPFPRSLMIGFTAVAQPATSTTATSATNATNAMKAETSLVGDASSSLAATSQPRAAPDSPSSSDASGGSSSSSSACGTSSSRGSSISWLQGTSGPSGGGLDLLPWQGRRAALEQGIAPSEVEALLLPLKRLPPPVVDEKEMESVRWFHREWLRLALGRGPALVPGAGDFNVPGRHSLAHRLVHGWLGPLDAAQAHPAMRFPQVLIGHGVFKYVLIRVTETTPASSTAAAKASTGSASSSGSGSTDSKGAVEHTRLAVWGDPRAGYHNDVFQKAKEVARHLGGVKVQVLGGGRIAHDPIAHTIKVYGYSSAFGAAPHELSAALLTKWYPLYSPADVSVSYDGY